MKENSPNFSFQDSSIFGRIKDSPSDNEGFLDKTIFSNRSGLTQQAKTKSLQISEDKNLFKSEEVNMNNTEKRAIAFEGGHFCHEVAPFEDLSKS